MVLFRESPWLLGGEGNGGPGWKLEGVQVSRGEGMMAWFWMGAVSWGDPEPREPEQEGGVQHSQPPFKMGRSGGRAGVAFRPCPV